MTLRRGFRLLPDVLFTLGLLAGFRLLTLSLLLFLFRSLPLFLLFLKECGMERHDFRWRVNSRHSSSSS